MHHIIGNIRLAAALCAVALGFFVFGKPIISPWWLIFPVAVFVALAVWHSRVIERRDRAARAVRFYEKGLERLAYRWMGEGEAGEQYRETDHVYADDLDLFGR